MVFFSLVILRANLGLLKKKANYVILVILRYEKLRTGFWWHYNNWWNLDLTKFSDSNQPNYKN